MRSTRIVGWEEDASLKSFREKMVDWVSSRVFRRSRVLGYVFAGLMLLAFYVEFVNIANTAAPLQVVRTPVDYVESIFVDFPIGIAALDRFLGWW